MGQDAKNSKIIKPFNAIIFGGDGDLALRKIYPALFHRFVDKQLNVDFHIYAITRSDRKHATFFENLRKFILESTDYELPEGIIDVFFSKMHLVSVPSHSVDDYSELKEELNKTPNYQSIYYLSTPSSAFGEISDALKKCGLINAKSKVVLEKPLGNSLASSQEIHSKLSNSFSENQILSLIHI
jgi:glucose-6-phosphate 1-dehydrogenase